MAQQSITIINAQVLSAGGVTGNGVFDLYVSATQNNNNALPGIRLIMDYSELQSPELPGGITAVVEAMNGSNWFPVAYQFEPFRNVDQGNQRIVYMAPGIDTYSDGIDSIVYVGGSTVARVSRQQGRVGSSFRLRLLLEETAFGGGNAFQSVRVSAYGELFDAVG